MLAADQWLELQSFVTMQSRPESDEYRLLAYLREHRDQLTELELATVREEQFPHLQIKSVSNIMSRLLAMAEDYLVYVHVRDQPLQKDTFLAQIYNRKGCYKLADQKASKVEKQLDEQSEPSLETDRLRHQLYYYQYYSDNPIKYREKGRLLDKLVRTADQLAKDTLNLYELETINWGAIQRYDYSHYDNLFARGTDSPAGVLIAQVRKLVLEHDVDAFWQLTAAVRSMTNPATDDLQKLAALYVMRYSVTLWNQGKLRDNAIVGELYAYGLEKGLLHTEGKLTGLMFLRVVNTLLPLQTMQEAEDFIIKWKHRVDMADQESLMHMAISQAAIYHEDYAKSLYHQRYVRFEAPNIKTRTYAGNVICLYNFRKEDMTVLRSAMRNFGRYLKANDQQIDRSRSTSMRNLFRFINDLLLSEIKPMTIKIENYNPIAYKLWAVKQLNRISTEVK